MTPEAWHPWREPQNQRPETTYLAQDIRDSVTRNDMSDARQLHGAHKGTPVETVRLVPPVRAACFLDGQMDLQEGRAYVVPSSLLPSVCRCLRHFRHRQHRRLSCPWMLAKPMRWPQHGCWYSCRSSWYCACDRIQPDTYVIQFDVR